MKEDPTALMAWITENVDLLAVLISFLALLVGLVTILIARSQARLANYARMHEALITGSASTGRRLLFQAAKSKRFPKPDDDNENWDHINQALATYDTLGVYYSARLIPKRLAIKSWHHPLKAILPAVYAFVKYRRETLKIGQPWAGLNTLLEAAYNVDCKCLFCAEFREKEPAFRPLLDGPAVQNDDTAAHTLPA